MVLPARATNQIERFGFFFPARGASLIKRSLIIIARTPDFVSARWNYILITTAEFIYPFEIKTWEYPSLEVAVRASKWTSRAENPPLSMDSSAYNGVSKSMV